MNERTLCGHVDASPRGVPQWEYASFEPGGAVQGKATDANMAREMRLVARMGHPCGEDFLAKPFLAAHPEFAWQERVFARHESRAVDTNSSWRKAGDQKVILFCTNLPLQAKPVILRASGEDARRISTQPLPPIHRWACYCPVPFGDHLNFNARRDISSTGKLSAWRSDNPTACRFENVRHEFLRIAVIERKPGALYLHHDAVTLFENMIRCVQIDRERCHLIGHQWLWLLKRFPVAAAKDFIRNHQFISGQASSPSPPSAG